MGDPVNVSNAELFILLQEINKDNKEIKADVKQIREDLDKQNKRVEELHQEIEELRTENKKLTEKVIATEKKVKRNNIVVFGIPEEEDEKQYFKVVLKDKLNINLEDTDINNIYRIGKKSDGKSRATILEFVRNIKKQEVFQNISQFKGSGLSVANDLMYEEREEQKLLYKHLRAAREKHYQAKIIKNKLIVNGESFTYEQLKEKDVQESESNKQNKQNYGSQSAPGTPSSITANKTTGSDLTKENTDVINNQEAKRKKREEEAQKEYKVGSQSSSSVSTRSTSTKKAAEVSPSPPAKKTKNK